MIITQSSKPLGLIAMVRGCLMTLKVWCDVTLGSCTCWAYSTFKYSPCCSMAACSVRCRFQHVDSNRCCMQSSTWSLLRTDFCQSKSENTLHATDPGPSCPTSNYRTSRICATTASQVHMLPVLQSCLSVSAGLELASDKWAWYWYLVLAVVCDLALAAIVYASYRWWTRRHNAQTAAALQQSKLGTAAAPTGGRAPVYMTASAAAGQAVSNPYYNRSFTPAPGLQQPLRSTYAYPGAY